MTLAYIGLGSNLDTPVAQIKSAIASLTKHPQIENIQVSTLYSSKPVGPQDQPDFVNAVASLETHLSAIALLDVLQNIEQDHHRVRERHWGPRTLDLDLLLFGDEQIQLPRLSVPHPFMLERGFVIRPLMDLAPQMRLTNGYTVMEHLRQLDTSDLVPIEEE